MKLFVSDHGMDYCEVSAEELEAMREKAYSARYCIEELVLAKVDMEQQIMYFDLETFEC